MTFHTSYVTGIILILVYNNECPDYLTDNVVSKSYRYLLFSVIVDAGNQSLLLLGTG